MLISGSLHTLPLLLLAWPRAPLPVPPPPEDQRISLRLIAPTAPPQPLEERQADAPTPARQASAAHPTPTPPAPPPTPQPQGSVAASETGGSGRAPLLVALPAVASAAAPAVNSVAAAPPSPDAPPAPQLAGEASERWEAKLMARLERHRYYPASARARRQQGVVWVNAQISREGTLLALRLEQGSGNALLDEAALRTFRRAEPLPPIPDDMPAPQQVSLPVEYFLR